MKTHYYLPHGNIDFYFKQTNETFVVSEVPLYAFSGEGEHLVLHVRKKNLTTWDMLAIFAKHFGINAKEIGYAGLKDKNAFTTQYISVHKKHEAKLTTFAHEQIKIIEQTYHNNKIKIGHLKGNRFGITLKKVTPLNAKKIEQVLGIIATIGMPNYFGYQRFGIEQDNYKIGQEMIQKGKRPRTKKEKFFVSAYQSYLFNNWLSKRVEISQIVDEFSVDAICKALNISHESASYLKAQEGFLKLFKGDLASHYPHGRVFEIEDIAQESARFYAKDITLTGLLSGKKVLHASGDALEIEKAFIDEQVPTQGDRRFAWVFPEEIAFNYKEELAQAKLSFYLPKGCYATVLLEQIAKKSLT